MSIDLDTKVMRTNNQLSTELAGGTVILHLQTGRYYSLNEVASFVWSHLDNPTSVRDLVHLQTREYDAPPPVLERDAIALLLEMREAGLVRTNEETDSA